MKMSKKYVKRPHVDWYQVLLDTGNPEFYCECMAMWKKLGFGSKSRAALAILRKYYSTTVLDRVRWLGESL